MKRQTKQTVRKNITKQDKQEVIDKAVSGFADIIIDSLKSLGQELNKKPLIYLASCHSDPNPAVREARYQYVMAVWKELFKHGHLVFSPIMHTHPAFRNDLPVFEQFEKLDTRMIDACDEVWVLMMEGIEKSKGVNAEIRYAHKHGKKVNGLMMFSNPPVMFLTPGLPDIFGDWRG